MIHRPQNIAITLSFALLMLSGCHLQRGLLATLGDDFAAPDLSVATQWQVAKTPEGEKLDGKNGWAIFNDAVLIDLLESANQHSATLADAKAKIEQARAQWIGTQASFLPNLNARAEAGRATFSFGGPVYTRDQYQIDLQSSWELDLFGGLARQAQSVTAQIQAQQANYQSAQIALSAEVASAYFSLRYVYVQIHLATQLLAAQEKTLQITQQAQQAGLNSVNEVQLALASWQESKAQLLQLQTQAQRIIKGLVALSALTENTLQSQLINHETPRLPQAPSFSIDPMPANVLMQRPDVNAAELEMAQACADIGVEEAARYPKLTLTGNIAHAFQNMGPSALMFAQTWSIGPSLSLPILDYGKRAANVEAAKARYEAASVRFHAVVRNAVKEVEEAMLRIDTSAQQRTLLMQATQNYQAKLQTNEKLYQAGLASLLDLQRLQRAYLQAQKAQLELDFESLNAWIALYRAVGGTWQMQTFQ
jgi:NodT family efflux transporter outer membrane factor (OMF) lipoprotein